MSKLRLLRGWIKKQPIWYKQPFVVLRCVLCSPALNCNDNRSNGQLVKLFHQPPLFSGHSPTTVVQHAAGTVYLTSEQLQRSQLSCKENNEVRVGGSIPGSSCLPVEVEQDTEVLCCNCMTAGGITSCSVRWTFGFKSPKRFLNADEKEFRLTV